MNEERMPAILMYPSDWDNDVALNRCSVGAQWLWLKAIWIMHSCQPYGHLIQNGEPITPKELAHLVRLDPKRGTEKVTKWVQEWHKFGVCSATKEGVLYSRRMVRDYAKRLINQQNGAKGGNPALVNSVNPPVNHPLKAKPFSIAVSEVIPPVSPPNLPKAKTTAQPAKEKDDHWRPSIEMFIDVYNRHCPNLVHAKEPTDERVKLFEKHWKRHPTMGYWIKAMVIANGSAFVKGDNDRAQRYGVEFLLRRNVEILEGKYDRAKVNMSPSLGRYVETPTPISDLPDEEFLAAQRMEREKVHA